MSLEKLLSEEIDRREFLETSGKAALAVGGGLTLDALLSSCATIGSKETRQDVERIHWDCNPILPIPDKGCYVGTNEEAGFFWPETEKIVVDSFKQSYGTTPAFNSVGGKYHVNNYMFPPETCKAAIELGVIPVMVYSTQPFKGYKPIIKGKFDDVIMEFAHKVAQFGHPIVLLPFVQPNEPGRHHTPWGGYPPNQYKDAWVRLHDLFSKEGANRNTIWSSKLKVGSWPSFIYPNPFAYIPPEQYIDIIGWQANNHSAEHLGLYSKFLESLFDRYYRKAERKYPRKPQGFWELSSPWDPKQHIWWDNTLEIIKNKYFRVKVVAMDVISYRGDFYFDARQTPETKQVIRKHFSDPYFIGSKKTN